MRVFQNVRTSPTFAEGYEMGFGSTVSLSAAIEAAESRTFLPLEEIELRLPELWREARAMARESLTAAAASRGLHVEKNAVPQAQIEMVARGMLLSTCSPGEQHALAALLAKK